MLGLRLQMTPRASGLLSVIVPVLNEEDNIPELVRRLKAALDDGLPFDVIFVDGGSTDRTESRQASWPKRVAYRMFYRVLARISAVDLPLDSGDLSLMDRRVVDVLNAMPERTRFVRGMRLGRLSTERRAVRPPGSLRRQDQAHVLDARAPGPGRLLRLLEQAAAARVRARRRGIRGVARLRPGARHPRPRRVRATASSPFTAARGARIVTSSTSSNP
jgi:hypothetical protein